MNYDLIVLGAGPGGYRAAAYAAQCGLRVLVMDSGELGGTCLNRGCIPTKTLAHTAELALALRDSHLAGLDVQGAQVEYHRLVAHKNQVVASLRSGIETLLAHPNVTLVREQGVFVDAHTVKAMPSGECHVGEFIIVATGSSAKRLPAAEIGGAEQCEELLSAYRLPRRLCIVGAGVIGMEFASIMNALGVEVTVVEFLKECLPALDAEVAKRLRKAIEKRGVRFLMQTAVTAVQYVKVYADDGIEYPAYNVECDRKGKKETIKTDRVCVAVGRKPNVQKHFANAGFAYDEHRGVSVNEYLQTTVPHIYAVGDVNGQQMLAHAAEMQALHAVNHLLGRNDGIRLDVMPAAIFTHPEAACVGLSEEEARSRGLAAECRKATYRSNGRAVAMGQAEGLVKLLSAPDGLILGCHAYGAQAAAMVQEVAALMCRRTTVQQLRDMVHIHPTLSEVLRAAAEQ